MTPSGTRGVLNDAISIYFADATLASAFVARWCRTVRLARGAAVRGRGCLRIGSGVPVAAPSIIPSRIGEVRLGAGVIRNRLVLSTSGSVSSALRDLMPLLKFLRISPAFWPLAGAVWDRLPLVGHLA